ncbi:general transcriptional corepressor trfA-like [Culicoides brevitarsis]|uniref:general transcriptional corepressor trfA-like n=1 Tax=Culicoides brevitarsis TaxID=469753 RepID=UPI00307BC49F
MPKTNVLFKVRRFSNKWVIQSFTVKEKVIRFRDVELKTTNFVDVLKWDQIDHHLRYVYLKENTQSIKGFAMKNIEEEEGETEFFVDNLKVIVKLKAVSSELLKVMEVKKEESYSCYMSIDIEEVPCDGSKVKKVLSVNHNNNNEEKTPSKQQRRHIDTPQLHPLPKLRSLRRPKKLSDSESEYKPTSDRQKSAVPEYVPSVSSSADASNEHAEYHPEPLSGSRENLLHYTPSSKKNAAKRGINSPVFGSTKKIKKKDDSQSDSESLAETLDNVSISKKNDLFGSDSENEATGDVAAVKKDLSLESLERKYGEMDPPKQKTTRTAKPRTKTSKASSSSSSTVQTSIHKYAEGSDVASRKAKKDREREIAQAERIAEHEKRMERINAERVEMEKVTEFFKEQIQKQRGPQFEQKLVFPHFTLDQIKEKFEIYRETFVEMIKTVKAKPRPTRSALYTAIFGIVDTDVIDRMSDTLHENFPPNEVNIKNWSHDALIADYLLPEWVVMLFRDEFNLDETEARQRIHWQSTLNDDSGEFQF